jgi:hypothetical protein
MRIQSTYKDYYDSGLSYGIDKDIYYQRKHYNLQKNYANYEIDNFKKTLHNTEYDRLSIFIDKIKETDNSHRVFYSSELVINDNTSYFLSYNSLFIGDDIIHFTRIAEIKTVYDITCRKEVLVNEEFIYDTDELVVRWKEINDLRKYPSYLRNIKENFNNYVEKIEKQREKYNFIFKLYDTPIFLLRNYDGDNTDIEITNNKEKIVSGIIINPVLKNIKLKTVMNPYECFQQISMFMTFLHNPEEEVKVSEMDDITKRDSHGFDNCSFKTCSNSSKKKKK